MAKTTINWIALVLVIIAALNLGLIGVGAGDVLTMIIGIGTIATIINIIIGLSAIYMIYQAATE